MTLRRVVAAITVTGALILLVTSWRPIWLLLTTRTVTCYQITEASHYPFDFSENITPHVVKCRLRVPRWGTDRPTEGQIEGRTVWYYLHSGLRHRDTEARLGDDERMVPRELTIWNPDGTIYIQMGFLPPAGRLEVRENPPWLWDEQDESMPTAPWWEPMTVERTNHREVGWYDESGFKAYELHFELDREHAGYKFRITEWNPDGTVREQFSNETLLRSPEGGDYPWRTSPPWKWGVTDQAEPSKPRSR